MAPAEDAHNDRELLLVLHTRFNALDDRLDSLDHRMERVEVKVSDALPDVTHRIASLEQTEQRGVSRKEAWIAAGVGAAIAWVLGWFGTGGPSGPHP